MSEVPDIQIIDKERYFTQKIIPVPNDMRHLPLAPNSVRLRTKVMGLSASNINVAKVAFLFRWWDAYPLPASLEASLADAKKYGRTGTWGYCEVLGSTCSLIPSGSYLWGYIPIGTLPFDVQVCQAEAPGHFLVTSSHREHMAFYNRYILYPAATKTELEAKSDRVGFDAVIRVMYETSHLIARRVFSEDPQGTVSPSRDASASWSPAAADLSGATVIHLAPGSKAALCLANNLKTNRRISAPRRVVGAASESSKAFVAATGIYDEVFSTNCSAVDILSDLPPEEISQQKVVLVDFGGRAGVSQRWAAELGKMCKNVLLLIVGSEISQVGSQDLVANARAAHRDYIARVNVSDMRDQAIAKLGEERYFQDLETHWEKFMTKGIPGFQMHWGTSMEEVGLAWDRLVSNETRPNEGLVFLL